MGGQRWTEDEIKFIKRNYENLSDSEMADELSGRTKNSVSQKRRSLDLYRRDKDERWSENRWSKEEIEHLKKNSDTSIQELAEQLNRTPKSVRKKKSRIGATTNRKWSEPETEFIERTYGIWKASEIAEYLGKTEDQVYNKARTEDLTGESSENWTDHEEELLLRMQSVWKDKIIADYLDRTAQAIRDKKYKSDIAVGYWSESEEQHIVENFPDKSDKELAEDLDRTVRAVKNRRRRKLGLIRPGMLEDTIWRPWEKLCLEIAEALYDNVEEKPELENGGIPDMRSGDVILEVKKSPFSHRVDEDVDTYRAHCDRLEFWCLYGRRIFPVSDVDAVGFEELKDRIRVSDIPEDEVRRLFGLMDRCRDGVNPFK
ncbi:hypothetical protein SAMN05443574_1401 [Haloarcula vallismortis]|uniref:Lin2600 dehydrogenase n=2 Tax=Haloarcula vallismortis TaxID=28442 RepID=M0JAZ8_HALVA|nr:hypothetical protein [Haloarcula vallismortis]EMA06161.1 Lin2600 dehydrogenase [Haloarcula vallismortis ATCC 29715]SDX38018.1 hypothetical protein SAMN05443574_1401 [Haloarcula vallismortis]